MIDSVFTVKEDDTYIAKDVRTSVASQGKTAEEALDNLRIALDLYYEGNMVGFTDKEKGE